MTAASSGEDRDFVVNATVGFILSQAIYVASKLGIADHLASGPKSAEELAELTAAHPRSLYRLLRYLASNGIFKQEAGDVFAQSSRSELLRSDVPGSLYSTAIYWPELWWEPFGKLHEIVKSGQTGFHFSYGQEMFDYLQDHLEAQAVFDRYMAEMPTRNLNIGEVYDFGSARLIMDIGGGLGHHLASALKANPEAQGVLIDLPHVVTSANEYLASIGLGDRSEAVAGNFFESVPAGGDIYLLGNILHDWDDEHCLTILNNCHRAMAETSKLLVIETIVPEGEGFPLAKRIDLIMLVGPGGQERTQSEFVELFSKSGLKLSKIISPGYGASVIEIVPAS